MGFIPQSGRHALVEVVFGFTFSRPLSPKEISSIKACHAKWKEFLPRVNDIGLQEVVFGPQGSLSPRVIPLSGVVFERIKPDGTISWRFAAEQSSIFVNCLDYDGWDQVWPRALSYVADAIMAIDDNTLNINAIILQTIDGFYWEGKPEDYSASALLKIDGQSIPFRVETSGRLWHLHQGWFDGGVNSLPGKLLNRVHFDAVENGAEGGRPEVRMDTTLHQFISAPRPAYQLCAQDGDMANAFGAMHNKNKEIMREYLSEEMIRAIGL